MKKLIENIKTWLFGITIHVNESHITKGKVRSKTECPIALAIKDTLNTKKDVIVNPKTVKIGYTPRIRLPRVARRFISKFDQYYGVKPFSFRLKIK